MTPNSRILLLKFLELTKKEQYRISKEKPLAIQMTIE